MHYSFRCIIRDVGLCILAGKKDSQCHYDQQSNAYQNASQKTILFHKFLQTLLVKSLYKLYDEKASRMVSSLNQTPCDCILFSWIALRQAQKRLCQMAPLRFYSLISKAVRSSRRNIQISGRLCGPGTIPFCDPRWMHTRVISFKLLEMHFAWRFTPP